MNRWLLDAVAPGKALFQLSILSLAFLFVLQLIGGAIALIIVGCVRHKKKKKREMAMWAATHTALTAEVPPEEKN